MTWQHKLVNSHIWKIDDVTSCLYSPFPYYHIIPGLVNSPVTGGARSGSILFFHSSTPHSGLQSITGTSLRKNHGEAWTPAAMTALHSCLQKLVKAGLANEL